MKIYSDEFYYSVIRTVFPGTKSVQKPNVLGMVSPVFICVTDDGTIVCRFSEPDLLFYNNKIGNTLNANNVPVPKTSVHFCRGCWFESYEYCPDLTLYEHMQCGMSNEAVFDVYKQSINIQRAISEILSKDFSVEYKRRMSGVFAINQKMRLHPLLAKTYAAIYTRFANCGTMQSLHNDIHSRNMLVSNEGNLSCLIDLDAIALCNESFSVLQTLRLYPLSNHMEFIECYEDTMKRTVNRSAIMFGLKALDSIRVPQVRLNQMLWRGYNRIR
ncbi:MAG: hypothetical protein IIV74_00235 [Alphaproteobacteria bacterium]|nr:hypothetical protein [Alphaproteobacteria bacterium]